MRKGLYAIIDPERSGDPASLVDSVLRGGCAMLQLRMKTGSDRSRLALIRRVGARCRPAGVPFFVNDRTDLAIAGGADGVHLGQDDLPLAEARRLADAARALLPAPLHIGVSTHDEAQAEAAAAAGADLIGFGPVYATTTKRDPDPVVGPERTCALARACPVPVVAIGGVDLSRALELSRGGVQVAAVIGALARAADPERTAGAIHRALGGDQNPW